MTSPSHLRLLLGLMATCLAGLSVRAEDVTAVASPAKRQASLTAAQALLSQTSAELPANAVDPFHSQAFADVSSTTGGAAQPAGTTGPSATEPAGKPVGPRSGADLLGAIAAALKPSGYFVIGGEPNLVFGQKRVKAGGTLIITFEGAEYTLEITAITRTSFTLRLNREEFTRPIK